MSIRVLLASERGVQRHRLRQICHLTPGWDICAEASTAREVIDHTQRYTPELILLDLDTPGMEDSAVTREILRRHPDVIIMLVTKDSVRSVRSVVLGKEKGLGEKAAELSGMDESTRLTPRETEVVRLLGEGRTTKEVATVLRISVRTAETHRSHVMFKLNLHSIGDLIHYAIRARLVEP